MDTKSASELRNNHCRGTACLTPHLNPPPQGGRRLACRPTRPLSVALFYENFRVFPCDSVAELTACYFSAVTLNMGTGRWNPFSTASPAGSALTPGSILP
jgi:hypothetical protein